MTIACITTFRSIPHKRPPFHFTKQKTFQLNFFRPLHNTSSTSLASHSQKPLTFTLKSQLSPSDTPSQRSEEWFALRRDKLTTSTFSTALGFWKGDRRYELWREKVFISDTGPTIAPASMQAMEWGVNNEAKAIETYKSVTGREVSSLGFATHSETKYDWVGASPDGLLGSVPNLGILEVKCPYNKGKPELALPWTNMPYYYMPQVQGQMEIMDRDWVDLYCWTLNGSTIFRVCRDRGYWDLIHGILREFWWENVVPAREALAIGSEEEVKKYEPTSIHKQTGLVIRKSMELASGSKLLCREIAGHVEFFRYDYCFILWYHASVID
ncbi:restriction endonuclease, type II-like superfamily protein [Tanacetum coccineum]